MAEIRIGTSGWTYPHWRGTFFPPGTRAVDLLPKYCESFDTVEVNLSFYRLPLPRAIGVWRDSTPPDFLLSVKAHRYITHHLKLLDAERPLWNFIRRMALLQPKLGPLFFQFPARFRCDVDRLEGFLKLLPDGLRFAFEFRHPSWFCQEVYDALAGHSCALALADTPDYPIAFELTADFVYVRLHGSRVLYQSSYSEQELREWAARAREWSADGRDVYVYFDNDFLAHAPRNALQLRCMLGQAPDCT
jgi:uncharacterized protein YecE (DUF72 family)